MTAEQTPVPVLDPGDPMIARIGADSSSRVLGVRYRGRTAAGAAVCEQQITAARLDRHGFIGIDSLGVLIDVAGGAPTYGLISADAENVVARLSVSLTPAVAGPATVLVAGETLTVDSVRGNALAAGKIFAGGAVIGSVTCRTMAVTRSAVAPPVAGQAVAVDDALDNGLAATAPAADGTALATRWRPQPWMDNGIGSVQGGVILGCAAAVADQAAAQASPLRRQVIDLSLEIMRSPTLSETGYRWVSTVLRSGRRLAVVDSVLVDDDGHRYAQSTATAMTLN